MVMEGEEALWNRGSFRASFLSRCPLSLFHPPFPFPVVSPFSGIGRAPQWPKAERSGGARVPPEVCGGCPTLLSNSNRTAVVFAPNLMYHLHVFSVIQYADSGVRGSSRLSCFFHTSAGCTFAAEERKSIFPMVVRGGNVVCQGATQTLDIKYVANNDYAQFQIWDFPGDYDTSSSEPYMVFSL